MISGNLPLLGLIKNIPKDPIVAQPTFLKRENPFWHQQKKIMVSDGAA
jgi:hypothetical protein